jgi:hypothetical protein
MVIYRVRATAGSVYLPPQSLAVSDPSNNDFANLNAASYENLAAPPGSTTIKAQHLIELRQAVNGLCDAAGVAQEFSSGEVLLSSLQGNLIQASDFTSLMAKANNIRTNSSLALPVSSFTTPPAAGALVSAASLLDLREALK